MVFAWCRFAAAAICLSIGLVFMVLAVFGVNRFHKALNRMHAAALGDTLGILFVFLGLMMIRGFSFDSLKLFLVILFFWIASPVSGHMISRLEAMTDEDLGEIFVLNQVKPAEKGMGKEHSKEKKKKGNAGKGEKKN
ncbi:MAG: monovalent cation/H(+) antiporter subunit G [Lachnospiraceae bacterium]|nr:monovalent cation/H(+) antiporter subunit G [Lachnospiraceae bacterium]